MSDEETPETPKIQEYEHGIDPKIKALIAFVAGSGGTVLLAWILGVPLGGIMETIETSFFFHFFPFIVSFILFIILVYRSYVQNIRGLGFLSAAVMLHGTAELLYMIVAPEGPIFNRTNVSILPSIADLLFPVAIIMIYLHIELTDKRRPNLIHAVGIIGTAAPMLVGQLLIMILKPLPLPLIDEIVDDVLVEIQKVVNVYLGLFSVIILWVSIFGFRVMYQTLRHADSIEISRSSNLVLVAFASLLTNFLLLGVNYSNTLFEQRILFARDFPIYNNWLVTFALLSLILAYILSPSFAYAVPFDVYQLLVINQEQGVTLYSFVNEIRQEGGITHDALKSPAIVAIQNLVREIAQASGYIILIGMSDRIIVMKNHEEIVSVLITQKDSYFLNNGLEDFTEAFYETHEKNIKNFTGNVKVFDNSNELVKKHLPFMRSESLIK